jgi:hypothetical protein
MRNSPVIQEKHMSTTQTQTTAAAIFVTVIGTIGQEPTTRALADGKPVVNAVLYDNKKPAGERAYSLAAFGSAVPMLQRVLTLAAKGTRVLSRKGENHKQAA